MFVSKNCERGAGGGSRLGTDSVDLCIPVGRGGFLSTFGQMLATGRVIQIEDRGLGMIITRALAQGMERVAFHLDRASVKGCREQGSCAATARLSCGEGDFFTGHNPFWGLGEGNEVGLGSATTGKAQARERKGSAHESDEIPARERILIPFGGSGRELAVQPLFEIRSLRVLAKAAPIGTPLRGRGMMESGKENHTAMLC